MPDRLVFAEDGQQQEFIYRLKDKLGGSWEDVARVINMHPRTIRDWAREKYTMPQEAALQLSQQAEIKLPTRIKVKVWREHLAKAGVQGNKAIEKKYGKPLRGLVNEEYRRQRWLEWWDKEGQYQVSPIHNTPLPFKKPRRSAQLAEFVGIMLGDGGISKYQLTITLHRYDDREFSFFVRRLIKSLFGIEPGIHREKHARADNIVVSRIGMVRYCSDELGLVVGNKVKQQVDIPQWIKDKEKYLQACVRGLIDTDGSVFDHSYRVNGKRYRYKKLSFCSMSAPLRQSVYNCFTANGLKPRMVIGREVRLDSQKDMKGFFRTIGSHNPKHLRRYYKWGRV